MDRKPRNRPRLVVVAMIASLACISGALLYVATRREPDLRIKAVAHQWWWEFDCPSLGVRTSDVLYLPSTKDVRLELSSADVIHSFWIVGMKDPIDIIPDKTRSVDLLLKSAGYLYGNCDSGCGCDTVCMRFRVLAKTPVRFQQWAAAERLLPPQFKPPRSTSASACATDPQRDHHAHAPLPRHFCSGLLDAG